MRKKNTHPGREGYKKDDLLMLLSDLYRDRGFVPTTRDADDGKYGLPSAKVFARVFGSFNEAKNEAGLPVDGRGGHNKRL